MKKTHYTYVIYIATDDYNTQPIWVESSMNKKIAKQNLYRALNKYPRNRVMRIHLITDTPFVNI